MADRATEVTFIGFNQDQSCIALGTRRGFRILSIDLKVLQSEDCGRVAAVEMLFYTSLVALVLDAQGGGSQAVE